MIVIGYQGIGKSTLAGKDKKYIDLESGNFWVNGNRADDWYKVYCKIAEHLSQQGYTVFTSSHEVVRNQLANSSEVVAVVYPDLQLRDEWIDKLRNRYISSGLEKDHKALLNAVACYDSNIRDLGEYVKTYKKIGIVLQSMEYDLLGSIEKVSK